MTLEALDIPRHWRLRKQRYGLVGEVNKNGELTFPPNSTPKVDLTKIGQNGSGNGHKEENPFGIPIYQAPIKEPVPA